MFERVQYVCTALLTAHEFKRYMRGSGMRFIQKESFHLSRHVSRHDTRNTQHVLLIIFFCSWSYTTAKVDHSHNTLRRSTETTRVWQLS